MTLVLLACLIALSFVYADCVDRLCERYAPPNMIGGFTFVIFCLLNPFAIAAIIIMTGKR